MYRVLADSLQMMLLIITTVGCHYFLQQLRLLYQVRHIAVVGL